MDFTQYKTASKFAADINAGYSARLTGFAIIDEPGSLSVERGHAWRYGWQLADQDEGRRA